MSKRTPLMHYDPCTGTARPYPSEASQYRKYHGRAAWLFNPYTGRRRLAEDVGSDPTGLLLVADEARTARLEGE